MRLLFLSIAFSHFLSIAASFDELYPLVIEFIYRHADDICEDLFGEISWVPSPKDCSVTCEALNEVCLTNTHSGVRVEKCQRMSAGCASRLHAFLRLLVWPGLSEDLQTRSRRVFDPSAELRSPFERRPFDDAKFGTVVSSASFAQPFPFRIIPQQKKFKTMRPTVDAVWLRDYTDGGNNLPEMSPKYDRSRRCCEWAIEGLCDRNWQKVRRLCPKSCGTMICSSTENGMRTCTRQLNIDFVDCTGSRLRHRAFSTKPLSPTSVPVDYDFLAPLAAPKESDELSGVGRVVLSRQKTSHHPSKLFVIEDEMNAWKKFTARQEALPP